MPDEPRVQELLDELLDREASPEEVCGTCPELLPVVRERWRQICRARAELDALLPIWQHGSCPLAVIRKFEGESSTVGAPPPKPPDRIGRYRIERVLGKGGFGVVYLGRDEQLNRPVAVKVPLPYRFARPEDAESYLVEARTVASLEHPHIVPVYDVGSTPDHPFFVVSKFVEGTDLATRLKESSLSWRQAAQLVATVAEALHYAHKQGLVHRDVKPGNILIDNNDEPYVVDFGLSLRDENVGKGPTSAGTPAYTSPEQARGEGHRVDGRSDIFSLGIVFYELLVGRRPFRGDTRVQLLEQITTQDPRPPRQYDEMVPKELERICLKALSKRATERYTTAHDLADDLRHFLVELQDGGVVQATKTTRVESHDAAAIPKSGSIKIGPKGLRSFDAQDADVFLELLPGPRGRDGLPDSIRFWKNHIEQTDSDETFRVGLIYGPSGCGKSSLLKAGLLPRLAEHVRPVYVEATSEETESRLLHGLRKRCPNLPTDLDLKETLAALRRGQGMSQDTKVLIVLDQFEQWLHSKGKEKNSELVQALRQCDGGRVQCVVMIRDDFWMAVTRLLGELELRLLEGQNSAAVDLFDQRHAEKVLAAFGRAFGVLPESSNEITKGQTDFLQQAVQGLAQEGKVICVRLALFAEMMKGKQWTPAALKEVGGTEGTGVTFLEETFSATAAPPEHRLHQKAARAVLRALLPEQGTDIKGNMRSHQELLEASGYTTHPMEFDDLVRILDNETRLITPADPEGIEAADDAKATIDVGQKYYQLTHDYLVPSLREWLTRKQKETRRGRAELLLADRAEVWNARPENRQLPSLLQWLQIRWHTRKKHRTPPQQKMMRTAGRYHAMRGAAVAVLLALAALAGLTIEDQVEKRRKATYADGLVQSLLHANIAQVPAIVREMAGYRRWTDPRLREENDKAAVKSSQELHTSLALLPVDGTQVQYLYDRLLDAELSEVPVIRDALAPHKNELVNRLWGVVENGREQQRLRAACALASYDVPEHAPGTARWQDVSTNIVAELLAAVQKNPSHYATLLEQLRPVRARLWSPLSEVYRSKERSDSERSFATNILADYVADDPQVLSALLLDAEEKQFAVIYLKLKEQGERGLPALISVIDTKLPAGLPSSDEKREKLAKQQANAAVALLKMNQPAKVWPLLKHSPDPRVRSYLIHRLSPLGVDALAILERLDEEPDVTIRRALLLSLGEYGENGFSVEDRQAMLPKLRDIYRTAFDSGLHAAAEWLLRQWQQEAWLTQVNEEWARDKEQREKRLEGIKQMLAKEKAKVAPQWYVNGQGQMMVVIPVPEEFVMGSPPTEEGRDARESQHKRQIRRTFALAAKPVTVKEFRRFLKLNKLEVWFEAGGQAAPLMKRFSPQENGPIILVDWFHAALYCNWLSEQEGIPPEQWCYETNAQRLSQEKVSATVMMLMQRHPLVAAASSSYFLLDQQPQVTALRKSYLSLTGYRLPTEAEWEYGCRAGAVTSRYFGETEELLSKYAWLQKNAQERTWPVGRLKPNDLGLFDMQGNVYTWCQERHKSYPQIQDNEPVEDKEDIYSIDIAESRVLRGGSFFGVESNVRSANRNNAGPAARTPSYGFRPARTYR